MEPYPLKNEFILTVKFMFSEWTGFSIKEEFKERALQYFKTGIDNLDFSNPSEAIRVINGFVAKETNRLIPELFDEGSIDTLSKLVLINVLYFKGNWLFPFDEEKTAPMEFYLDKVCL